MINTLKTYKNSVEEGMVNVRIERHTNGLLRTYYDIGPAEMAIFNTFRNNIPSGELRFLTYREIKK